MDVSTAAIRFRIAGAMRFLSHAETSRVLQRACVRAGIAVRYSQGFNPHPRLSLPLPRPVGVESEDELLVVKLCDDRDAAPFESRAEREAAMKQALAEQLPEGMDVLAVDLVGSSASFQPQSAQYVLPVRVEEEAGLAERLSSEIARVMASDCCMVERTAAEGKAARSHRCPAFSAVDSSGRGQPDRAASDRRGRLDPRGRNPAAFRAADGGSGRAGAKDQRGMGDNKTSEYSERARMETRAEDIEDGTRDVD